MTVCVQLCIWKIPVVWANVKYSISLFFCKPVFMANCKLLCVAACLQGNRCLNVYINQVILLYPISFSVNLVWVLHIVFTIKGIWGPYATTSCKSTWDTVPYFGIDGLSMILCLWSPLHPLSKLLAIQDHTQNLEEQLWMGGRREVSIIFYRPVTRSDLKRERSFFRGSVASFLQLVVANVWTCPQRLVKKLIYRVY